MRHLALCSVLSLAAAAPSRAAEISVGAGPSCTTHTIADALALAGASPDVDTIRLADDQAYTDQAVAIGTPVTLIGGHAACGDLAPSGRTALVGTGDRATLSVHSATADIRVRLENLDIGGGGAGGDIGGSGGVNVSARAFVSLADVAIHDNLGVIGGGLRITEGALVELERNVDIHHNRAYAAGGGIYLDGSYLRVRPHGIAIRDNEAQNGGGIAMYRGANVSVGTDIDGAPLPVDGVLVAGNKAGNTGGGVVVNGFGTKLLADDTVVRDNSATEGGGVYVSIGGYAQFARFREGPFRHCPGDLECLRLSGNTAERGGALAIRDGGSAHVDETIVRDNVSADGTAFSMHGDASELRILGSLVAGNRCFDSAPGCPTIYTSGGKLRFEHSTFAGNPGGSALIWGDGALGAITTGIEGYSSLVAGKEKIFDFLGAIPTVHYDCVLKDAGVEELAATRSAVLPILFQDPARGDFRLPPDSHAVDWCDGAPVSSQSPDMDGTRRGLDTPRGDRFGPYDLGAYESDRIFARGFESRR